MPPRRKRLNRNSEFRFVLEIDPPPRELAAAYNNVADALSDMRPVFRELAPKLGAQLQANIDARGSGLGESWPNPHSGYANRKSLDGYGSTPMVRKGDLRKAVPAVVRLGKSSLAIGLKGKRAKRGAQLQFKRGYVFMGWSPAMQRLAVDHIDRYVEAAIADSMRKLGAAA